MKPLIPLVFIERTSQLHAESTVHMSVVLDVLHRSFSMRRVEPPKAQIVEINNPNVGKVYVYVIRNMVMQGKKVVLALQLSQLDNIYFMISAQNDQWCEDLEMCLPRRLGEPVFGVVVPPSAVLHDCVKKKFHTSLGKNVAFIRSITHVMNPHLLKKYEKRKIEMKTAGGGEVIEDWLFHGTKVDNVGSICARGFRLPQHKHCLGQYCSCDGNQEPEVVLGGPWTSDSRDSTSSSSHPSMANQRDPNALRQVTSSHVGCRHYMFLSRVLLGDSAPARRWYEKPPLKEHNNKRYDSCYGSDIWHTDQWAVFDESQTCPEYIIEYEKVHNQVLRESPGAEDGKSSQTSLLEAGSAAQSQSSAEHTDLGQWNHWTGEQEQIARQLRIYAAMAKRLWTSFAQ